MKLMPFLLLVLLMLQTVPLAIADHDANTDPLPNLRVRKQWFEDDLWEWVDQENGRYNIIYRVENKGESGAVASNTTINITIIPDNGSAPSRSSVISDPVPELNADEAYDGTVGPFTCLCNHTVIISICSDGDDRIAESSESDNCKVTTLNCPRLSCEPDLTIESCVVRWVNHSERTFNLTYTVVNIGNGDAGCSTSRVNGRDCPVPALASGENHSGVVGPFLLSGYEAAIEICADNHDNITESSETNNCYSDTIGLPDLLAYIVSKDWIDAQNRSYGITYTVCNCGGAESENATIRVYIDCDLVMVTDHPLVRAGECVEKTFLPFTMTGDNDTIRVCVESDGDTCCDESIFRYSGCMAADGSGKLFTCGDWVDRSCTFTGDIYCDTRESGKEYPHGLFIGADDIVIDGCGYAIIGDRSACSMQYAGVGYIGWTGIRGDGFRNVTIRNLTVRNFCNGISIANSDDTTIEGCEIRDNGANVQYNYGITVENSSHVTIDGCEVRNSLGILTDMNVCGGHGINFDCGSSYCNVTDSTISGNYLSGILAPPTCKYLCIANNTIEGNGCCGRSGFCAGVNLHWRGGYGQVTNSTVLGNVILNNTGSGIHVTQGGTTIRENIVKGSRNGTGVTGTGILIDNGKRTFLYNNTCCGNEGTDIADRGFATFGDCNACDRTENYDDEGTIGCIFYCGGANGVCVGENYNFSCGMVVTESCRFSGSMNCEGYGGYGGGCDGCEGEDCGGDCGCGLIAGADDIVIDGCGYTIAGNRTGVGIFSNRTNVTIKNLQILSFSTGMEVAGADTNAIENCTLRKNSLAGINFSADQGTLRGNRVYDNSGTGIVVAGNENLLSNNTAARNSGDGISFGSCAANNSLTANAIGDNTGIDIHGHGTDRQINVGDDNTCDFTQGYSDAGRTDGQDGCTYPWTPPDLVITRMWNDWVDPSNGTYNVTYAIENIGEPDSRKAGPSTTWLHIDRHHIKDADDPVGSLSAGERSTATFDYAAKVSCDRDRVMVCVDGADEVTENNDFDRFYCNEVGCYTVEELFRDKEANNCMTNVFEVDDHDLVSDPGAACVAAGGVAYRCGDTVEESCTFDGNMGCPAGHGLVIGKNDITIDGDGYALIGPGNASCAHISETDPGGGDCGIYNYGYDRVTIKDLTISGFCNGIGLHGAGSDFVEDDMIENCVICRNGNPDDGMGHGIHLTRVKKSVINGNEIYGNTGVGDSCGDGGDGIFMYQSCDNVISGNVVHENRKGGIFLKKTSESNEIAGNTVTENGQGGIILRCISSGGNTIAGNVASRNDGDGIHIGSNDNIIRNNEVEGNRAGHLIGDTYVEDGDGIDMGRSDGSSENELYENAVCKNEGVDIHVCHADGGGNHGSDNCCDTTENYGDDDGDGVPGGCTNSCEARLKPDLTVTKKSETWINPESPENRRYNVTCTVENIGIVDALPCVIRVSIDDGAWQDSPVVQLNASGRKNHTFGTFTMSGTSDEITVRVDPEGEIDEWDEGNNHLTNTWYAKPDLTVTAFDVPRAGNLTLFTDSTANATIVNIGTVSTKGAFDVTLCVNGEEVKDGTFRVIEELAPGDEIFRSFNWFVGASNEIKVVADSGGEIDEWDEGNNDANETRSLGGGEDPKDPINTDPKPFIRGNLPEGPDTEIDLDEVTPGGGVDYDMDELGGNDSTSGCVSKERVSAQLFRSTPFLSDVSDIVVSSSGLAVIGALSLLLLFYFGYRGELTAHRRNNR